MKTREKVNKTSVKSQQNFPAILNGHDQEVGERNAEGLPQRVTKNFHALQIPGWLERINLDGVHGTVEKKHKRLKPYLNRWRDQRKKPIATAAARLRMKRGTYAVNKTRAYKAFDELVAKSFAVMLWRDILPNKEPPDVDGSRDFEDEDSEDDGLKEHLGSRVFCNTARRS
jgi:hypothetical protein